MKVTISREFNIEAAHFLPKHEGKCRFLHGHRWELKVCVSCDSRYLINGMVMDYSDLDSIVKKSIVDCFDHQNLNDVFVEDPTSENIAIYIFESLDEVLSTNVISLDYVSLKETEKSECVVRRS